MKSLFSIFAIVFFAVGARADIFVEPWVGYEVGTYKFGAASSTGDIGGSNYGARLGYKMLGFMAGAEYSFAGLTDKPSSGTNFTQSATDLGVFVGFNFPILLRVYATYFVTSTATLKTISAGNYSGSGYRIGAGFTGLPFIVINAEIISRDYTKYSGQSYSGGDLTNSSFCVNVSLPIP